MRKVSQSRAPVPQMQGRTRREVELKNKPFDELKKYVKTLHPDIPFHHSISQADLVTLVVAKEFGGVCRG